jgi:hypothetical protein
VRCDAPNALPVTATPPNDPVAPVPKTGTSRQHPAPVPGAAPFNHPRAFGCRFFSLSSLDTFFPGCPRCFCRGLPPRRPPGWCYRVVTHHGSCVRCGACAAGGACAAALLKKGDPAISSTIESAMFACFFVVWEPPPQKKSQTCFCQKKKKRVQILLIQFRWGKRDKKFYRQRDKSFTV